MQRTKKYEPYVIGVQHTPSNARGVFEHIMRLGISSIGIERSRPRIRIPETDSMWPFWKHLLTECERHHIRVDFLMPYTLADRVHRPPQDPLNLGIELLTPKITTFRAALIKDSLPRIMERKALRTRPDAIITGRGHAALIASDLNVPRKRLSYFPHMDAAHRSEQSGIDTGVRRFRFKRKIKKSLQLALRRIKRPHHTHA
jgi:hypothetical protein